MTTFVGTDLILQNDSIHNKVYAESYNVTYKERDSQEERLIVKFKNQIDLPYEDGIEKRIKNGDYDNNLKELFSENKELTLNRLFSSVNPIEIEKLSVHSKSFANQSANNLLNYYIVQAPNNIEIELLLKKFETSPLVEEAYIQEKQILTPLKYRYKIYLLIRTMILDLKIKDILKRHQRELMPRMLGALRVVTGRVQLLWIWNMGGY